MVRRVAESAFVGGPGAPPAVGAGVRLRCEAERQGDSVRRLLYVARVADEKTRATLTDSFVACMQLKSEHVIPFVDAGSFGDHAYGAMAVEPGITLSRLVDPLAGMTGAERMAERAAILAAVAASVALGLEAGHAHAGKGLVHDALDLESIHVDQEGRVRVDAAFLDPWIAAETIPSSAARFVAEKRWTPPAKSATDVQALAALLLELCRGDAGSKVAALLARTAKGEGPTAPKAFATEVRAAADVDLGQVLLAELASAQDGPPSHTQIGVGLAPSPTARLASAARRAPAVQHTLPRVEPKPLPHEDDAPPMTARLGSLEANDDGESDATIVEPLAAFDVKADDKTPMARVPAAQIPLAKPGPRAEKPMASTMPGAGGPGEKPTAKPAPTVPTVLPTKAPAKGPAGPIAKTPASPVAAAKPAPPRPAAGAAAKLVDKPAASASEKTPIAMDMPTAAQSMRGLLARELTGSDEEDGSTVVAPLWSEAMAKATRDDASGSGGDTKTRRARYAEQQKKGGPKVVAIPKMAPVPRASSPGLARASSPGEKTPMVGQNLPVLWSDEAAPESEEQATIAQPLVPDPAPSGPLVSYAMENARFDDDDPQSMKNAHEVTTARGPIHRAEAAAVAAAAGAAAAAPTVDESSAPKPILTKNMEPTPARGTARGRESLPIGWMIAAFLVAAGLVALVAFVARSL